MKNILVFAMILISSILQCQTFTDVNAGLAGGIYCSVKWGDYDNDDDLDILLSGKLYRNDSGVFTYINTGIPTPNYCSVDWGDYDNDGDLDIAICGSLGSNITKIYRNDGNDVFTDINAGILGVYTGSVCWGDYDNDGDLDILLTGYSGSPISRIYRNDNGSFSNINAGLTGVYHSSASWGDYDNDGDLDILLCGMQNTYEPITIVYRNDNENFTNIDAGLRDIDESSVAWGDHDSDGDLDILLSGEGYSRITKIYSNNNGNFTDINAGLTQCEDSSVAWGDFDNDGDLDILLTGNSSSGNVSIIYNNNSGVFTDANAELTGIYEGSVAWGDYDNDGDLDILMSGSQISKVYRNESVVTNTLPNSPHNLSSSNNGNDIELSWDKATDTESPQDGLTYNVYFGTESQISDRLNPMSNIPSGYRKIPDIGNCGHNTSKTVINLPSGTYYWSVQTIDNAFSGSAFSYEQSFVHTAPLTIAPVAKVVTNCSNNSFVANWNETGWVWGYYLDVAKDENFTNFIPGYENRDVGNVLSLEVTGLSPETIYYYRVRSYNLDYTPSNNSNTITIQTPITFTEIPFIIKISSGDIDWGDYDNDGDLDLASTGYSPDGQISKIYRNDSGIFTDINAELNGVYYSSVAWGDYDNDGNLDIVLAGRNDTGRISKIYRNNEGVFIDINAGLIGLENTSLDWGDYDNDGDLDLVLTGRDYDVSAYYIARIYRNDFGIFNDINAALTGVENGSSNWGDYDNDGDLDIIISGKDNNDDPTSVIYRNDFGIFIDINAGLEGLWYSSAQWGDYDYDGDMDILLTGQNHSYDNISKVYRNDFGVFTDINAELIGENGVSSWGDIDNDGDLDILIKSTIYRNDNGTFNNINVEFEGKAIFGDYDNDGDLDILTAGYSSGYFSNVYRNECSVVNNLPESPTNLQTQINDYKVEFNWDKATDKETAQNGLSYNLYIGSESQTSNNLNPMSDINSGYRKVVDFGNAGQNNSLIIKDLPSGLFYWSVQTIDNSYSGSSFSPEQTFEFTSPLTDPPVSLPATETYHYSFKANWNSVTWAVGYRIDVATDSLFTNFVSGYQDKDVKNVLSFEVTGLTDYTTFYFRVRSYNSDLSESENSNTITTKTLFLYFSEASSSFPRVSSSSSEWGDYDNDGDLDVLLTGKDEASNFISRIYRNDTGIFTDINAGLIGVIGGSEDWGDYDNDGDLDILQSGWNTEESISRIYRNNSGIFTNLNAGLMGVTGDVSWGDYDNDGDLDILLTGRDHTYMDVSKIYRNDSGVFTDIDTGFEDFSIESSSWCDYDNDGDLDIFLIGNKRFQDPISGDWYSESKSILYENNSGTFTEISSGMWNLLFSVSVDWGDYDNDGDLDILLAGRNSSYADISKIYRNNSDNTFTDINAGLTGVVTGSVKWGDFDNDGDLDVLLTGSDPEDKDISKIYSNDSGIFTDIHEPLTGVSEGSASWGDYDNDGDLDLILTGLAESGNVTDLYMNNNLTNNTIPKAPFNLSSVPDYNEITFNWEKATDNETPQDGLSYNLYIGTESQFPDILNPMSNTSTGFRKIVSIGNAGQKNTLTIEDLDEGTYYWSVQAIDHSFAGSEFAPEQTVILSGIEEDILPFTTELFQNYPNPFNPETVIKYSLAKDDQVKLIVFDIAGREVIELIDKKMEKGWHEAKFNADKLTSGMYFYQLKVGNKVVASRKMMMLK